MDRCTEIIDVIRSRFPLLFIDEAQDNSEEQSSIIERIYMDGDTNVIRQRFGDNNQAIFDSLKGQSAATAPFPDDSIKADIPSSHRFGQKIADLANPLGLEPHDGGLSGKGPRTHLDSGIHEAAHTVFLFEVDHSNKVLKAYGQLLLDTFSDKELEEGTFSAVGYIHRPPDVEDANKFPHHVGHYWPEYDPELTNREPKPQTFCQYVSVGVGKGKSAGESYLIVEKMAEGVLRLAGLIAKEKRLCHRQYSHRYVLQLLGEDRHALGWYKLLLSRFAIEQKDITESDWNRRWRRVVTNIALSVANNIGEDSASVSLSDAGIEEFLRWGSGLPVPAPSSPLNKNQNNIYTFSSNGRTVDIRMGSIHSIKGETHTATLVLETYWQDKQGRHNLELLLPWLDGRKSGGSAVGVQQQSRLKLHYVAMTRPTHLLCLALKRCCVDDGIQDNLRNRGWMIEAL